MRKRIFLSVPGLVCCAGADKDELYESCLNGNQSGIIAREFAGGKFPTGTISRKLTESAVSEASTYSDGGRIIHIINTALEQIRPTVEKALAAYGPKKIGVCLGSCDNGSEASLLAHREYLTKGGFPKNYNLRYQSAAFAAEFILRKFALEGPGFTVATACASGASAIIRGAELVRCGLCGAVIAGGADIVSDTVLAGFHSLEAVSDSLTNPFSRNRKGINLGEGAAFFVLSGNDEEGIELLGAGESCDAHHMTAPAEDGAGPVQAMEAALKDAGLNSDQISYVNLHGTGTALNDRAESFAMKDVFGTGVPASSTKPVTGHTLGAAGALEAAIVWMALSVSTQRTTLKQKLPVHCCDGEWDDELPFLPRTDCDSPPSICMTNSFAFGGCNVSLILGRAS